MSERVAELLSACEEAVEIIREDCMQRVHTESIDRALDKIEAAIKAAKEDKA